MAIRRVAAIFDERLRPDTAGVYVRRALAELVEVAHFPPEPAEAIPRTGFDLYLSVDDDTEHRLPASLRPRAYWAIDTHLDFEARLRRSADCDLVLAAQRDGAERLRATGIESATWLPLACDPAIHRRHEVPKQYDVAFVGHIFPGPREELLRLIAREFPGPFIGRAFFDEMAKIYSASRVVFNRSLLNDVNMRVFEALACGSLLVTNDLSENGQAELFQDRVHLATYREPGELIEVIRYYLAHPDQREAIAAAGRAEAVGRHTYRHRMERLLIEAERVLGRRVVAVPTAGLPSPHPSPRRGEGDRSSAPPGCPSSAEAIAGPPCPGDGLASVIVPCFNQRGFTQLCLQALFRFTRPGSWELIVVDNGSTVDTAAYLAGVQDTATVPVTVITNPRNVGFPAAINQGLQVASGEYLVLLNNDAVVTAGWLEHLIALTRVSIEPASTDHPEAPGSADGRMKIPPEGGTPARAALPVGVPASAGPGDPLPPEGGTPAGAGAGRGAGGLHADGDRSREARDRRAGIGLVGPMSNYAAPPQLVEDVPYRDLDAMNAFAGRWRERNRGQWLTAGKLSGFCLVMKRAVYQAIVGLDERFELGFFDDDDLALRARRAGFELAVARDVFVHHFGSRTFVGNGIDAERLLEENERRFAEKWGRDVPQGRRVALRAWDGEGTFHAETQRGAETQRRSIQDPHSTAPRGSAGYAALAPRSPLFSASLRPSASLRGIRESASAGDRRARVSLTMIVRDEEENLPRCLESVRGIFDEVVVVDTGSVDRTREIARDYGARVFEFA